MFERLKQWWAASSRPSSLGCPIEVTHPLARQICWSPLSSVGASFRTHRLVFEAPHRIAFHPTNGAYLFAGVFIAVGLATVIGVPPLMELQDEDSLVRRLPLLFGLILTGLGLLLWYRFTRPVVFDATLGYFWRDAEAPEKWIARGKTEKYVALKEIRALQLLPRDCHDGENTFISYELNLVLADGSRRNVVNHGNRSVIRDDASTIAELLEVPLWDAS
jgi:hypothetical protein